MLATPDLPLGLLIRKLGGAERLSGADERAILGLPTLIREVPALKDIVHEGTPPTHCCVVLDGWTCGYRMLEGRRQILSIHIPGEVPDLQSLHLPEPDFGMAALTPARVAFVPHADMRRLIAAFPAVATALWHETLLTAAIHRAWMAGLGRRDARGRLAHLFCEMHVRITAVGLAEGHVFPMPLRQHDLADALGQTSVHINRTLKDMRGQGLIVLRNRRLEILDWPGLCAAAEFDPGYLHLPA